MKIEDSKRETGLHALIFPHNRFLLTLGTPMSLFGKEIHRWRKKFKKFFARMEKDCPSDCLKVGT
jgi:hypothetical protein